MDLWRGRLANKYIFFELLPTFIMGVIVFVFVILMFQSLRLTEYVIVHGQSLATVTKLLGYLTVGTLPIILPMSLLFSVLLTYGRMSADSEIVAFKALGLKLTHIAFPAFVFSLLVGILSAETSFYLAPWANGRMEIILNEIGQLKPGVTIKEGVFSEGFFDLVVYANKVDSDGGLLKQVFIYDERNEDSPFTIIAKKGKLIQQQEFSETKAFLRLYDGNIHRTGSQFYTKIDFESYDINLFDSVSLKDKKKTPFSYTLLDLNRALSSSKVTGKARIKYQVEYHKRWAIAVACLIFGLLGVGLGTVTNRRASKSSGFVMCIILIVGYWLLYATAENVAKGGVLPVALIIWSPNLLFALYTYRNLQKAAA